MISILHHLHHMKNVRNGCAFPVSGSLDAIMEPDTQKDTDPATDVQPSKHVLTDILWLCRILGFLEQFLHAWHSPTFLRLFYAVTFKNAGVFFVVKGCIFPDGQKPELRRFSKDQKIQHRIIARRAKHKITNDGSDTKFIATEHKAYSNSHKPVECGFTGKTEFQSGKKYFQ